MFCLCVLLIFFCLQVAQQEAQRAQFVVEKAKQEKQQKVVQAEGEAQAARLVSLLLLYEFMLMPPSFTLCLWTHAHAGWLLFRPWPDVQPGEILEQACSSLGIHEQSVLVR